MSRHGAPDLRIDDAGALQVVMIASQWHATVMDGLLAGARRVLK